jgi:uncharacterized membrane protein
MLAFGLGLAVVLQAKGTSRHRWTGRLYLGAMLAVNGAALTIYELTGGFGIFHGLAVVSLVTLSAGFAAAALQRPRGRWP